MAALAVLLLFPHTREGRALRRFLVEAPAKALNRLRRGHWALATLLATMVAVALAMDREGFVVAAQAPEVAAWFAAFDIATYVDVIATALVVAAAPRFHGAVSYARARLAQALRRGAPRARRIRRPAQRKTPPAGSEEEPWPAALALA